MEKISIYYKPDINQFEKAVIKEVFRECEVDFLDVKTNGIAGGAIDVEIIFDILKNDHLQALLTTYGLAGLVKNIIKIIFAENNKKTVDNNSRPRYTNIIIRTEKRMISVSNINPQGDLTISKITSESKEIKKQVDVGDKMYSDEELEKYLYE